MHETIFNDICLVLDFGYRSEKSLFLIFLPTTENQKQYNFVNNAFFIDFKGQFNYLISK